MSWYFISLSSIMNSSCSAVYFFLKIMMWKYLISRSIMINIESYCFFVTESLDLDNLTIKFIVTSFQDDFDDFWYWISSYLACVVCLFCWQLRHLRIYVSILCLILRNEQFWRKNCSVLLTFECFFNESSWCFLIHSLIWSFDIWSFSFSIRNYFWSSLIIFRIAFNSCSFVDSDSFLLIFRMLWLNIFLIFIWSHFLFNAFVLSFFFSEV